MGSGVGDFGKMRARLIVLIMCVMLLAIFNWIPQAGVMEKEVPQILQEFEIPPEMSGVRSAEPTWSPLFGSLPTIDDYYSIDFGDVNNDGNLDIVYGVGQTATPGGIHCYVGDGAGGWIEQSTGLSSSGWCPDVEVEDLNNDGNLDIACRGSIYTGDGGVTGSMVWTSENGTPTSWNGVALGDVDNNGVIDIVAGTDMGVKVWTSNGGDGGFVWSDSSNGLPTSGQYFGVFLGDVNNDGKLDVAAGSNGYEGVKVWTGNGEAGLLASWTDAFTATGLPTNGDYAQVVFGDANCDGKLDLAAASTSGSQDGVKFWKGNGGEGGFSWTEESGGLATTGRYYGLNFGDVNNDGKLDLVGGNYSGGGIDVWLGDGGEGGSQNWKISREGLPGSTMVVDTCIGDVNNDGRLDIGATTENQGVQVWQGSLPAISIAGWTSASTNLPTTSGWYDVVFGDVNHDGKLDLAAASSAGLGVKVWTGDGSGIWNEIIDPDLPSSGNYNGVRLHDVNHDGDPDLIVSSDTGLGVRVHLGNGTGGFGSAIGPTDPASPPAMGGVSVADINVDGNVDIITSRYNPNSGGVDDKVYAWLGDGNGGWGPDIGPAEDLGYDDVALGDVDHDGAVDLLATGHMQGYRFWTGDGTGSWSLQPQNGLPITSSGLGASFGDLDHDGHLDIAIGSWVPGASGIRVFTSNGGENGSVWWDEESSGLPTTGEYAGMELGDVNRDGNLDILTASCWNDVNGIELYYGNGGSGGLMQWTDAILPALPATEEYWGVAFGDINLDGILDIAVASSMNGVQVYITQIRSYTQMELEEGWNLISLPMIQTESDIPDIFSSIDGKYDAVQYYETDDSEDHWKHHHFSKEWINDLESANHTQGLWIYVNQPGGCDFTVYGDEINTSQSILFKEGWNLVGFPSITDKQRDTALNNIIYGTDIDKIQTYDSATKSWVEIGPSDSFEVGRGYWIHSIVDKTWIVPL
jgi:hypothetical protein